RGRAPRLRDHARGGGADGGRGAVGAGHAVRRDQAAPGAGRGGRAGDAAGAGGGGGASSLLPADGLWPAGRGGGSGAAGAAGAAGAREEADPAGGGAGVRQVVGRGARVLRLAEALYRVLLGAYPRAFRERFAEEMALVFRDASRAALEAGGLWRLVMVWLRFLFDLLVSAARERRAARRAEAPVRWRAKGSRSDSRPRRGDPMAVVLLQDVRHALRALVRRPGVALAAALTLAVGVGANVAIFAVVNAVLIRPLPYPESERLVMLRHHAPGLNLPELENSPGTIRLYRTHARSFSSLAVVSRRDRNLLGGDRPARVPVAEASPELFDVLRVQPVLGRRFLPEDAEPGAPRVAVLTHAGWSARFGRAPDIVGRVVQFDGEPTEIVGVMPEGFAYPDAETVALVPLWVDPNGPFGVFGLSVLARLGPGVT